MILRCPKCSKQYSVNEKVLWEDEENNSRDMVCSNCKTVWTEVRKKIKKEKFNEKDDSENFLKKLKESNNVDVKEDIQLNNKSFSEPIKSDFINISNGKSKHEIDLPSKSKPKTLIQKYKIDWILLIFGLIITSIVLYMERSYLFNIKLNDEETHTSQAWEKYDSESSSSENDLKL